MSNVKLVHKIGFTNYYTGCLERPNSIYDEFNSYLIAEVARPVNTNSTRELSAAAKFGAPEEMLMVSLELVSGKFGPSGQISG